MSHKVTLLLAAVIASVACLATCSASEYTQVKVPNFGKLVPYKGFCGTTPIRPDVKPFPNKVEPPRGWCGTAIGTGKPILSSQVDVQLIVPDYEFDPAVTAQMAAFLESRKAMEAWERAATELYKKSRVKNDSKFLVRGPIHFTPNMLGRHSFPKEVLDQMPPRPKMEPAPAAARVNAVLKLTNVSKSPITLMKNPYGDDSSLRISVKGPGAAKIPCLVFATTTEMISGQPVKIQPGESLTIDLKTTRFGRRGHDGSWAFTKPGRYQMSLTFVSKGWVSSRFSLKSNTADFTVYESPVNAAVDAE